MERERKIYEAPNGGWGWMVVVGGTIINMFNQSLLSIFGLLFGSFFTSLNESKTRIALVMNLSSAFLNLTGLITAPLMKKFSPREVAIFGCLLVSFGLMLSSLATTLVQVIFTYSLCVGIGLGLLGPSIFISLSSYFTTRKSRAVALTMAGTGFGQMIFPQVVRLLLTEYGFRGTVLIMGSLSLHGVIGACLFQPVAWHLKRRNSDKEEMKETEPLLSRLPTPSTSYEAIDENYNGFWRKLARSLDLSLLKDPRFVILNVGLSIAYTVSIDFTLILPFFLQESALLDKSQTAICMSTLAGFDLLSRLTFHFLTDRLRISNRSTFMIGTLTLGIVRSILAEQTNFTLLIITCAFFGYFRALTVVNQVLTVSEFCTKWYPQKLPGALGLNMIIKGISVITIGELLGWIRDVSGSYQISLHTQNILLSLVMIVWIVELTWYKRS